MCGRFTLAKTQEEIAHRFKIGDLPLAEIVANYNIPPTAKVPMVVATSSGRRLELAKWGLKREWAPQITNLQEEKVLKGTFKKLFGAQRGIIPADGFYEWGVRAGKKYPVWFHLKNNTLFGFPAIFDEGEIKTFTIFTTQPNAVVSPTHDRMPVILQPEHEDAWLDPKQTDVESLHRLLTPYPASEMACHEVTPAVSYAKNNSPDLIRPI